MTDTPHYPEGDEISLLDLLQTIVDNFRLLVIDPIASRLSYTPQMPSDDVHKKIKEQIKASINNKDKLLTPNTQVNTPQAAQARRKEATQTAQLLARKLDSAGGTSASKVAQGYAQMIEVTKNGYGQYLIFVLNNIALR
jgi:hypothetical protein